MSQQPKDNGAGQQKPPARTSTGSIPVQGGLTDADVGARPGAAKLTSHQRTLLGSDFADNSAERRRNALLAATVPQLTAPTAEQQSSAKVPSFDGKTVPEPLQNRDLWKSLSPPATSGPGKRTRALYDAVLNQFGLTVNPRYDDDAPGKQRGHIFAWDVSRAMGCEIPHFVGAKELTLAQTCDWVRHEGPMRGWKRVSDMEIFDRANGGYLVVALPREARVKFLGIVRPQEEPPDSTPRLMGIGLRRGEGLHPRELFGSKLMDCFFHD